MAPQRIKADELASVLPPGGLTLVSSCSAESDLLASMVSEAGDALADMRFSGIFVPSLNHHVWAGSRTSRVLTFFQTPQLREAVDRVDFLPLCYGQITALYAAQAPQAALFMCSPPDENGMRSFGTETAFVPDFWRSTAVRIAHANPAMPRTADDPGIPFGELTAFIEQDQTLKGTPADPPDAVSRAIAGHAAPFIGDGATPAKCQTLCWTPCTTVGTCASIPDSPATAPCAWCVRARWHRGPARSWASRSGRRNFTTG